MSAGESTVLVLVLVPPPQDKVQAAHDDHSLTLQATAGVISKSLVRSDSDRVRFRGCNNVKQNVIQTQTRKR